MFGCFVFAKLGCFVKQSKKYFYFLFLYYSKFRCSGNWLILKSGPELCLIISRAARYLPKQALNNIPSLCVYYDHQKGQWKNWIKLTHWLELRDELLLCPLLLVAPEWNGARNDHLVVVRIWDVQVVHQNDVGILVKFTLLKVNLA